MKELIEWLNSEIEETKAERRKCWREDIEEKNHLDGKIEAFQEVRHLIKNDPKFIQIP